MNASELSKILKTERTAVIAGKIDVEGMEEDLAVKIGDVVDVLVPAEEYEGYAVIEGEYVVFKRFGGKMAIAVVEENRVRWCLNRMRGLQW